MRVFLLFFSLLMPAMAMAADSSTRDYVLRASMFSHTGQLKTPAVWVSTISVDTSRPTAITNSSGTAVMSAPNSVVSGYDATSTRYSTSNFYKPTNIRQKLIAHVNGFNDAEIFSIGYDSGYSSQKFNMSNAFFVGYTKSFGLTKSSVTAISFGGWFAGSMSESPCVDSYDRQYSCRTLTAWSDYKPSYPRALSFIDIKHVWVFN